VELCYFKEVLEASYDLILIKYCISAMLFTNQTTSLLFRVLETSMPKPAFSLTCFAVVVRHLCHVLPLNS